ncbi:hypothetical protein [Rhodococcus sp. KBW08]|uniref:hypothetical protein n=2 Tax=unclassified Rhodococcus (in: high G+C Gram-positive bacteria) TaxID=192944 RepID=UPI000F599F11|nr:hypothetical protein [Rhodococcus sp. KBW08]
MASIYKIDSLDMGAIFSGKDVTAETYNLARYFMKYLGCRIDDSGLQVPNEIVKFCDGGTFMPHGEIAFFRDKALNLYIEMSRAASIDVFPLTHSAISGWMSPENNLPINLHRESVIGNLGVMYAWNSQQNVKADPFYRNRKTTLHERKDLPLPEQYERSPDYLKEYRQIV